MKILTAIKNYFTGFPARIREQIGSINPKNYWAVTRHTLWPEVIATVTSAFVVFVIVLFMLLAPFLSILEVLIPGSVVKTIASLLN